MSAREPNAGPGAAGRGAAAQPDFIGLVGGVPQAKPTGKETSGWSGSDRGGVRGRRGFLMIPAMAKGQTGSGLWGAGFPSDS